MDSNTNSSPAVAVEGRKKYSSASYPGFAKHGVDKEHQVYEVWPVVHLPVAKQQG